MTPMSLISPISHRFVRESILRDGLVLSTCQNCGAQFAAPPSEGLIDGWEKTHSCRADKQEIRLVRDHAAPPTNSAPLNYERSVLRLKDGGTMIKTVCRNCGVLFAGSSWEGSVQSWEEYHECKASPRPLAS